MSSHIVDSLSKLFVRITVIGIGVYFMLCYVSAVVFGVNIWEHTYVIALEICVCLCLTAQGTYHCRFIRWTAYGILIADSITELDSYLDFLPYNYAVFIPIISLALGFATTLTLSIRHYIKVKKMKRKWQSQQF